MARVIDDAAFLTWLKENCGYTDLRPLSGGRWAGILPLLFTHAIVVGKMGNAMGYEDRWCYASYGDALKALEAWTGSGEPEGWHRHPVSGRRRKGAEEWFAP